MFTISAHHLHMGSEAEAFRYIAQGKPFRYVPIHGSTQGNFRSHSTGSKPTVKFAGSSINAVGPLMSVSTEPVFVTAEFGPFGYLPLFFGGVAYQTAILLGVFVRYFWRFWLRLNAESLSCGPIVIASVV